MTTTVTIPWACPKCGAKPREHGNGGADRCQARDGRCDGFICECDDENEPDHGQTFADPCTCATCTHCGWGGTFPVKPKGLQSWEKKALDAGWSPPAKRAKELKLA